MGKYGKKFRKAKIKEWEKKYLDYKKLKQKIKKLMKEKIDKDFDKLSEIEKDEILGKWIKDFTDNLDNELRTVYIFFSKNEKLLYKDINVYLHIKDDYINYTLEDYVKQYQELKTLSNLSLNMSNYVYVNLQALMKILKKFDKKIIGLNNKNEHIKNSYIISKLEEQNSDVLYLINFKMIDEVNVILDDLIKCLKEQFKNNKNKYKNSFIEYVTDDDENNSNQEKLINNRIDINRACDIMDEYHRQIVENIKNIDMISNNIANLFLPWKEFLRISGDVSSRLIQLSKELSFTDSMGEEGRMFRNNKSIVDTLSFSKQNSINIFIILYHAFLYMYSFSVVIPLYPEFISSNFWEKKNTDKNYLYYGFLMMMTSIGALISYIYESTLFRIKTKIPLVISSVGLLIGNALYYTSIYIDPFILLFLGRFLIGVFNLRTHNKMYIINFLLKKDVSFFLTMFHTLSMLGLASGFLLNIGLVYLPEENKIINPYTTGPLLSVILCSILLILSSKFFTEARSRNFNITSMKSFSGNPSKSFISNNNPNIDNENNNEHNVSNLILEESTNEELNEDLKNKTVMVNDINDQLGNFNRMSKYNDTNLVSLSISELADKEKEGLHSLFSSFLVYLLIIFTTKFINESIFINLPIFIKEEDEKNGQKWVIPFVFGISCLFVLAIEFMLRNKHKIISEKNLLIVLLSINLVNDFLLIFLRNSYGIFFFIFIGLAIIVAHIIEKYATHFFYSVIPQDYIICKIQGNIFINVFSMFAKIIASILIIALGKNKEYYNLIIYISFTILNFICFVLFIVFYSDIRIKSISRILNKLGKNDVKVATEV
jgi:hypothetical protein